jgi:hypothetical protein
MQKTLRASLTLLIVLAAAAPAFSATFIVPSDREMVRRAHAIVVATPLTSYTQLNAEGGIETVTPVRVEEVIKGRNVGQLLTLVEPGGEYQGRSTVIPGIPRFETSERVVLFIVRTGRDRWAVAEIALGKFTFKQAGKTALLVRDANEINGWDPDLTPHEERSRDAGRFLQFLKAESSGAVGAEDYFVRDSVAPLSAPALQPKSTAVHAVVAPYTATSYTILVSGNMGGRWAVFPNAVTFLSGTTQEPGAPGGGTTAINAAFGSWDNDCGSNVNYVYGGTDNGTHTQGLHAPDGANTILFERDLSSWGVAPFTCSGTSYGGTLGIGGVTNASGTNVVNGETFATTQEADVEMNRGIANCSLLFNNGDFNSAVTHEVGHTLGFRHSDQDRSSAGACTADASLECSNTAIMKSFITTGLNAALQAWDQHAVQAVYPGNVCAPGAPPPPPPPPTCTPPAITFQPASATISSGSSATLSVAASGTTPFTYQWFTGASGNTGSPISGATGTSITVSPTTTTSYWARVTNSCGSANSATATVTVTVPPPPPNVVARRSDFNGDGKSDVLWYNTTTGELYMYLLNGLSIISQGTVRTISTNWDIAGTGDFNGDGKSDIYFRNHVSNENWVFQMNGLVVQAEGPVASRDASWKIGGFGDFNGDGRTDVLWRNTVTGDNVIDFMNGISISSSGSIGVVADQQWLQYVGDFNGDKRADILWRHAQAGQNYIWFMNGLQRTGEGQVDYVQTVWNVAAVADLNGDGKSDIVWRNTSSGAVWVYLMNGLIRAQQGGLPTVSDLNYVIAGCGDYNGDGKADLLWRNLSSGQDWIWFLNGFTIISEGQLDYRDLSWRIGG